MKRLFDRFDGASLITSKAPSNAKIAVVFGANLTEMLFTVDQPSFSNGCTIGKTCDGRDFILNCLIPLVMIDLPDDFPREEEITVTVDEEEPRTEEATVKVLEDSAPEEDVVVKVVEEGSPAEETEAITP